MNESFWATSLNESECSGTRYRYACCLFSRCLGIAKIAIILAINMKLIKSHAILIRPGEREKRGHSCNFNSHRIEREHQNRQFRCCHKTVLSYYQGTSVFKHKFLIKYHRFDPISGLFIARLAPKEVLFWSLFVSLSNADDNS